MNNQMKFSCLTEKGKADIRFRPLPALGDYDVLIDMKACNICTTDYQQWLGLREQQGYPMAGGHESSGVIIAVGSKVEDFKVGDFVARGYEGCGQCAACRSGNYVECSHLKEDTEDGYKWGFFGFSDYMVCSTVGLYKMNKDISPSEASFLEPVSTVVHGIHKIRIQPTETVVVLGAGTMGLLNALVARAYGANVIVTELMEKKIKTAEAMGFTVINSKEQDAVEEIKKLTDGKGADVVIPAVGNTFAYQQAMEMLKDLDGRFLVFAAGYPKPELDLDPNTIHYKRMDIIGTYGSTNDDFEEAAKLISHKIVDVSALVEEKTFPLDDIQNAYEYASRPGMYRVSVTLD